MRCGAEKQLWDRMRGGTATRRNDETAMGGREGGWRSYKRVKGLKKQAGRRHFEAERLGQRQTL